MALQRAYVGINGEGYLDKDSGRFVYDLLTIGSRTFGRPGQQLRSGEIFMAIRRATEYYRTRTHKPVEPIFQLYFAETDWTLWLSSLDSFTKGLLAQRMAEGTSGTRPVKSGKNWKLKWQPEHWLELSWKTDEGQWTSVRIYDAGATFGSKLSETAKTVLGDKLTPYAQKQLARTEKRTTTATRAQREKSWNGLRLASRKTTITLAKTLTLFYQSLQPIFGNTLSPELHGPGKLAENFLNILGEDAQSSEEEKLLLSTEELYELLTPIGFYFANDAFFGGIFETLIHGIVELPVHQYDLNSAYPAAIAKLPSLRGATIRWTSDKATATEHELTGDIVIAMASFESAHKNFGALPVRTKGENFDGSLRPDRGLTAVPLGEILAAERLGFLKQWTLHQALIIELQKELPRPFSRVEKLYERRLTVGKKTPEGLAIKLILNSIFGKLGTRYRYTYANPIYAALVTSSVRVAIMEAIATHPWGVDGLLRVETDAVFFVGKEHDTLPLSNKLGEWEKTSYPGGVWSLASGQWGTLDGLKDADDGYTTEALKTRGFTLDAFTATLRETILPALKSFTQHKQWDEEREVEIRERFLFLGLREAWHRNEIEHAGALLLDANGKPETIRTLKLAPGNRGDLHFDESGQFFRSDSPYFGTTMTDFLYGPSSEHRSFLVGGGTVERYEALGDSEPTGKTIAHNALDAGGELPLDDSGDLIF